MQVNPDHPSYPTAQPQPTDPETWTQVAEVYYAQGRLAEAIAACEEAIKMQSDWAAAYVTMGNVHQAQNQVEKAVRSYQHALELNPNLAQAHANLGSMFYLQGKIKEAIASYRQAVALKPDLAAVYWNLAKALKQTGQNAEAAEAEQRALQLNPQLGGVELLYHQGNELALQGKIEEAIATWQKAINLKPDFAEPYCQIGMVLRHQGKYKEAIPLLEKAIELKPDFVAAHQHLCGIYRDGTNLGKARQAVDRYTQACEKIDPIMTAIYGISTYQVSGLNHIAKERFLQLESKLNSKLERSTPVEIKSLYANLLFSMPYLRDDPNKNIRLHRRITKRYIEQTLKSKPLSIPKSSSVQSPHNPLRIGILSSHFNRHSVGWCSFDSLQALSQLPVQLYLYSTEKLQTDDRTVLFEQIAHKLFIPQYYPNGLPTAAELIQEICNDEIDVLLDLDALSLPLHADIFYYKPAPVCISWLGFDALQINSETYFLADQHSHPKGYEKYYTEKLLRMPHSFVALSEFQRLPVNARTLRHVYRISADQIVYLCVSPGRKFSRELAQAQVKILQQVPNSVLIHKGLGDSEVFRATYWQACETLGVGKHRIKFLPRFAKEEEHRQIYALADVLLDSYPYNGGTHTLEALWFDVPVVTRTGEQFLSRMGYSFLKGLSIEDGIAQSWEEYIKWGARFGNDEALRKSVQEKLVQAKQPEQLAPLWNPSQFAHDLYEILKTLFKENKGT